MASYQHEILKGFLNALSVPMHWILPPVTHLRSILEGTTMFATLPWGVDFERVEFEHFGAEWLRPKVIEGKRVLLYIHGGGFVIGSPHSHRALAGKIAKGIFSKCLLIDYRKAPEHPFPAALDDAFFAYSHLLENGYDPNEIVVAGDSAGGGLAVSLLYYIRDHGLPLPACLVLLSPYLDLTRSGKSHHYNAKNDRFLDIFEMRKWARLYSQYHEKSDPLISPLFGDFTGLPPILIQASESEVLFDDSTRFVEKAESQSLDITFQTWHGLIHWWHMFGSMPEAKEAINKINSFINEKLK